MNISDREIIEIRIDPSSRFEIFRLSLHSEIESRIFSEEEPEFELILAKSQQYGKRYPTAAQVYGELVSFPVTGLLHRPYSGEKISDERLLIEWKDRIIISYKTVYKWPRTDVYGFLAFSFNERRVVTHYFVPTKARLRSIHYALCYKQ